MKYSNVDKKVEVGDWVEYNGEIAKVANATITPPLRALIGECILSVGDGRLKCVREPLTYISSYKNKPNKHWKLIEAWGKGAEIEGDSSAFGWGSLERPAWDESTEYRRKPDKSTAQLEKESIQVEMEKLSKRLEELDISGDE